MSGLFAGVDRAVFVAAFAGRLRSAGVDCSLAAAERCAASMVVAGPVTIDDMYWLLRVSLVRDRDQIDTFDSVFDAVFSSDMGLRAEWRGEPLPAHADDVLMGSRRSREAGPATSGGVPWITMPSISDGVEDDETSDIEDEAVIPELQPSAVADDLDRPFDQLDDAELGRISKILEGSVKVRPQRRTRRRRFTHSHSGPVSIRHSIRDSLATGGELFTLTRSRARYRPRPVAVLLDVSGSMEPYSRAYLHLLRPLALEHRAEVFVFATEMNRITPAVRLRSPHEAIRRVTSTVDDRFSGTRLASSLNTLLRHRTWHNMVRGAVVMICSDGWDSDDPQQLDREMGRLARLAHRVVWVNPRAGVDGFEPLTTGMATALPHCDSFLAGDTARSMGRVVDELFAD